MPTSHSYEEIRAAVVNILAGREQTNYPPEQYANLSIGVAEVFERRELTQQGAGSPSRDSPRLGPQDAELLLEVFWNLFREGLITLGVNDANREFPFFRVSHFGKNLLANQPVYFFHDVSTYEALIRGQVPTIDDTTLLYLKEAMQAFRSGCLLSASVMLGVATEHTFLLLLEKIEANAAHASKYVAAKKEWSILKKFNRFRDVLERDSATLAPDLKEDLDTQLAGILSIIRTFRNESGHPTGKIIDREQAYVLLNLFIPYAKKMYQLMDYFAKAP